MITKFISGLSGIAKKLLAVALVVVIAWLFDILLVGPTMTRLATINDEIAQEKKSIKDDLRYLSHKNEIIKESDAVDPYFIKKIPSEDEIIAAFLKQIEVIANKANVVIAKVTPSVGQDKDNYMKYTADLECSGKFTDVINFMHLLNSADELTKVTKFNLSNKKSDSDEIKAIMSVSKMIISKESVVKPAKIAPLTTDKADASTPTVN